MKYTFEQYSTGTQSVQYAYDESHIYSTVDGVEYKAEIDQSERSRLDQLVANDYIGPARIWAEVAGDMIDRAEDAKAEAERLAARDRENYED